jgi:hypothetical protein
MEELTQWWMKSAHDEIVPMAAKMVEYGGNGRAEDLLQIGHTLAATQNRKVDDEEATELGIYFYLVGKMARWTAAVVEGDRPSDDTLHDISIYTRMAQRARHSGGWPN